MERNWFMSSRGIFLFGNTNTTPRVLSPHDSHIRIPTLRPSCNTIPDRLLKVLESSMLDEFWALIKAGADIETRDRLGRTPLHLVIYWKKELAVVKAVLSAGADPNSIEHLGSTPIHAAVHSNSSPAIIQALLSAGADVNMADSHGSSPLMNSIYQKDNVSLVRTLLKAGANVMIKNLMLEAVKNKCDPDVLKLLLLAGTPVNTTTCGFPPIFYAVLNDDLSAVRMLLAAGARIDFRHPQHRSTLLHHTSMGEIAIELIKYGIDVNATDLYSNTPLQTAVMGDNMNVASALIRARANVHAVVGAKGDNALHLAKSVPVIKALLSRGLDINTRNLIEETPLHCLLKKCSHLMSPIVRLRGTQIRYYRDSNCSPEMNESILAVKEMLRRGADVNAEDRDNKSVLELAVSHGHSKMVAFMIQRGVEVCWDKLFKLEVFNVSAMKVLIRESLIGNVLLKGRKLFENSPLDEMFLISWKRLWSYSKRCLVEIQLMKMRPINCSYTLHHFVVATAPTIKPLRLCSHSDITHKEYSAIFPIYKHYVAMRVNHCFKRALLLDILDNTNICAPSSGGRMVRLISDCKFRIAEFLSNRDLFNFLVAMGFGVSWDDIPSAFDKTTEDTSS